MLKNTTCCPVYFIKQKGGKNVKLWYGRVQYTDDAGKRKQVHGKPEFNTKTSAKQKARDLLNDLDKGGQPFLDGATMRFDELADYYERTFLIEPVYIDGRKVLGLRNKYDFEKRLKALREFFGDSGLRSITHADLQRYRVKRLKTPVVVGRNTRGTQKEGKPRERQRSIATVHRELSLMRRIMNIAFSNGWILRNPFEQGEPLIKPGDEKPRERILTREEEERILALCNGEWEHLRAIIICALDTGMRRGEMFKLEWSDVDLESGLITVEAFNTKTMRQREVALTDRLAAELRRMSKYANGGLVFGIKTSVKTTFNKARKKAGLPDLRFHDLRHTNATRLVGASMPLSEVGRMLGHTQPSTTYRYVNANVDTAKRAAELLNQFNKPKKSAPRRRRRNADTRAH
jgi:integrase